MGNCSCTCAQSQPEQKAPCEEDVDAETENPLIGKKSQKSLIKQNGRQIVIGYEAPNINIYRSTGSWKSCNLNKITTVASVNDGKSEIEDYSNEILSSLRSKCDELKSNAIDDDSTHIPIKLIDSETESSKLRGIKCQDLTVTHNRIAKRCLIVQRAIKLNFELINLTNNNNNNKDKDESIQNNSNAGSNTTGKTSTDEMTNIANSSSSSSSGVSVVAAGDATNLQAESGHKVVDPPSMWFFENETLEDALCNYCKLLNTIPSNIQFYKKIEGNNSSDNNDNNENKSGSNVIEYFNAFETLNQINSDGIKLKHNDTLMITRKYDENSEFYNEDLVEIYVKTLENKKIAIKVNSFYKVLDVKYQIFLSKDLACKNQLLLFVGHKLVDSNCKIIGYFGVSKESTLHLVIQFDHEK